MNYILVGNIITLIGSFIMLGVGFLKKRKQILSVQIVQFSVMCLGNFVLRGYSGSLSNIITITRNAVSLKRPFTLPFKLGFTAAHVLLTVCINRAGLLGWCPVVATFVLTYFLDAKDERLLKAAIIVGQIFWAIYDLAIHSYTTFAFDLFTIASNLIGIIAVQRDLNRAKD